MRQSQSLPAHEYGLGGLGMSDEGDGSRGWRGDGTVRPEDKKGTYRLGYLADVISDCEAAVARRGPYPDPSSAVTVSMSECLIHECMVWYGAPPTPWTAIVATRWWQLDRAPAEHAQTESVPSIHESGMVWYGAPPTPWTAIVATRWWQLDRAPAEHAQTESVPSELVRRWVSFPQGQAPFTRVEMELMKHRLAN
jgi:hypothetical protein